MISDLWTVVWKEWKEQFLPGGRLLGGAWSEALTAIGVLAVVAAEIGPLWVVTEAALYWLWLPLLQMVGMIAESVAGERERHTLETLLASRLPDRAILFGKLAAAVAYGWGLVLGSLLAGLVAVNLVHRGGGLLLYPPATLLAMAGIGLLGAGLVGGAGVLISLRSATVRQAYQRLSIALLMVYLPVFAAQYLSGGWRTPLSLTAIPWLLPGLALVLVLVDSWLLAVALSWFQRDRLLAT